MLNYQRVIIQNLRKLGKEECCCFFFLGRFLDVRGSSGYALHFLPGVALHYSYLEFESCGCVGWPLVYAKIGPSTKVKLQPLEAGYAKWHMKLDSKWCFQVFLLPHLEGSSWIEIFGIQGLALKQSSTIQTFTQSPQPDVGSVAVLGR